MTEAEIEKGVKEILSKRLNISTEKILKDSKFVDDLGMDSFGAVEVMFEIEDKFGIEVNEKDLLNITTVKNMVDYITNKLNKNDLRNP